jgi:hypothetical protein
MLVGATVLCFLVLLALLADRYGARIRGDGAGAFYRCEQCDLRYRRRQLADPGLQVCPYGHPIRVEEAGTAAGTIGIFICLGFLAVALALLLTGVVT